MLPQVRYCPDQDHVIVNVSRFFIFVWTEMCGSVPRERSIHHLELLQLHGVSNLDGSQDGASEFWLQQNQCKKKKMP